MKIIRVISVLLLSFIMVACASAPKVIDPKVRKQLNTVETVLSIPQEKMIVTSKKSGPSAVPNATVAIITGVVAGISNAINRSKANKKALPIITALKEKNINLDDLILAQVKQSLNENKTSFKIIEPKNHNRVISSDKQLSIVNESNNEAVLFLTVSYSLEDGEKLAISMHTRIVPNIKTLLTNKDALPTDMKNLIFQQYYKEYPTKIDEDTIVKEIKNDVNSLVKRLIDDLNVTEVKK